MFSAVIVAAGSGQRMGLDYNKIFYKIRDKHLIEFSVQKFLDDEDFKEVIIVVSKEDLKQMRAIFAHKKIKFVIGGSTRQRSVFNGLSLVTESIVFIHDSARPNVKTTDIQALKGEVAHHEVVVLYGAAKDSIVTYKDGLVLEYLNRNEVGLIQTPQCFNTQLIKQAHSLALKHKRDYTDDASLIKEELDVEVHLVEGNELNIKATTIQDLKLLEEIL